MSTIARWENSLKQLSTKRKPIGLKPPVVPEREVKKACLALLEQWGLQVIRNNTGLFSKIYKNVTGGTSRNWIHCGLEGSGDLVTCAYNGRFIEIEVKKSKGGKQSPEQIARQKYIEGRGGLYILARSLDDLIKHQVAITGRQTQW